MESQEGIPSLLKKEDCLKNEIIFQNYAVCRNIYSDSISLSDLHQHQFIEISYVAEGKGWHRIWNEVFPCSRGSFCILNEAVPHGYFAKDDDSPPVVYNLIFDVNDIFKNEVAQVGSKKFLFGIFSANNFAVHISLKTKQLEIIESLYNAIADELAEKQNGWEEALYAKLSLFLIFAKRMADENVSVISKKFYSEQQAVAKVIQFVDIMYSDPNFSLANIAELLYISKSSASRIFHSVTGEYFSDYLRFIRMKKAAELMLVTELSNEKIAGLCGYRDMPNFYRQFKRAFGYSPGEYRKRIYSEQYINNKLNTKETLKMSILQEISEKLQKGKAKDVSALVTQALEESIAPNDILNEGLVSGMNIIGEKFRNNQVFVPEVLVAARAMNAGLNILKPALSVAGVEPIGKAVICTVKGDMHDIGKNLVKMMIEGQGIECIDLGVDVDPERVVETVKESGAQLVCLSALLTTTMMGQKDVIDALSAAGIRDNVKVMVGGAPITQEFADEIGADCYTLDAASAAQEAKRLILEGK